ncbi:zinc finger HIT domain-containing protein 2 [Electrophorus electricus]|uniref:zinc finger HIT domain-containing protein 2 n=1 Tax=Electrophorus electricus TaxID=8005 RepID=UPI0015D05DD3|nr:zinc finger HIT domain-containing protein 2 [Electrophorus electricus]
MDRVLRRRIPECVRTLLTDTAPEEVQWSDWREPEPEPITKDGISLPARGGSDLFITPAGEKDSGSGSVASSVKTCGLCLSKPSCYTCPRCNMPYCGLSCYQSPRHSACSEEFYKECVTQELKFQGTSEKEGRNKMQDILLRLRHSADVAGGMDCVLKDLLEESGGKVTGQDAQVLELLSRLAEIQASKEERSEEIEEILHRLQQIEGGLGNAENEEDEEDLTLKLSGLNIDALTEEELWSLLPSNHKEQFKELIKGRVIGELVPLWSPWWEKHEQDTKGLIEELELEEHHYQVNMTQDMIRENIKGDEETQNEKDPGIQYKSRNITGQTQTTEDESRGKLGLHKQKKMFKMSKSTVTGSKSTAPPISAKILPLQTISANPSPLVQFNLINTLYAYTFSLCLFNGDISEPEQLQEFCQAVLVISECLGCGRVFHSVPEALEAGVMTLSAEGYADREDADATTRAVQAVAHILTGESREDPTGYTLAALSQLQAALGKAKALIPKEEKEWRHKCFLAIKKCGFFQSWVKGNPVVVRRIAGLTWSEYCRRSEERVGLEKEKEKGRRKMLIEEIK